MCCCSTEQAGSGADRLRPTHHACQSPQQLGRVGSGQPHDLSRPGLRIFIIWLSGGPSEELMEKRLEKIKCQLAALCSFRCAVYPEITAVGRDEAC